MKWNELDLKISLSSSQAVAMQAMIEKFLARKQHYFCEPVFEGSSLKINSSDFINFLDQAEFGNEFDWYRLKNSALKAIIQAKTRKKDSLIARHYKNCEEMIRQCEQ